MDYINQVKNPNKLRIREQYIAHKNAVFYQRLKPLFVSLKSFNYAVIKGEALSIAAYGNVGFRDSGDIDILIEKKDISLITNILNQHGFRNMVYDHEGNLRELTRKERIMFVNSHQTAPFYDSYKPDDEMNIDVNTDVFWGEYTGRRINTSTFLQNTIDLEIHGCKVKVLSDLWAFTEVCLHHYKEMNSIYSFNMKNPFSTYMFQDIYCFYKRCFDKNYKLFIQHVIDNDLSQIMYYLFFYTHEVFKDPTLLKIIEAFKSPLAEDMLNYYGLAENERKQWRCSFEFRLDHPDLFSLIRSDLSEDDIKKIEMVTSVLY